MSFELCVEPAARASEIMIYASIYKGQVVPFAEGPFLDFIRITHREGWQAGRLAVVRTKNS